MVLVPFFVFLVLPIQENIDFFHYFNFATATELKKIPTKGIIERWIKNTAEINKILDVF
jgi:hypothetical protein